jgi:AHBA synthesis associated protein
MAATANPIRAVVFDLDGVLIDSIEVMREAFQAAYAEAVGPGRAPFEAYLPHLGRHMPDTLRIMGLPAAMYDSFVRFSRQLVHRVQPCPGARELLDELRAAGVRLAVATGKTRDRADHVLDAVGMLDALDAVCGSDEVANGKPAPDLVELALDRIGMAPDQSIMVGDSVLDLQAGRAAGTRVAAALWGQGQPAELLAEAPHLTASCDELATHLRALTAVGTGV